MGEQWALVTGASSGLGRDIARALGRRGYRLILVARRVDRLQALADELGGGAEVYACDLTDAAARTAMAERYRERVNLLVNNAGLGAFGRFWEAEMDQEARMIHTNVEAPHHLMKLFLPAFVQRNEGRVLNICSAAAFSPGPRMAAYYATKAYLLRLTEGISEELRQSKSAVTVTAFCPGPIRTEFDKVAQVRFTMPYLTSEKAAESAVRAALRGVSVRTPGAVYKLMRVASHLAPDGLAARIAGRFQREGK